MPCNTKREEGQCLVISKGREGQCQKGGGAVPCNIKKREGSAKREGGECLVILKRREGQCLVISKGTEGHVQREGGDCLVILKGGRRCLAEGSLRPGSRGYLQSSTSSPTLKSWADFFSSVFGVKTKAPGNLTSSCEYVGGSRMPVQEWDPPLPHHTAASWRYHIKRNRASESATASQSA